MTWCLVKSTCDGFACSRLPSVSCASCESTLTATLSIEASKFNLKAFQYKLKYITTSKLGGKSESARPSLSSSVLPSPSPPRRQWSSGLYVGHAPPKAACVQLPDTASARPPGLPAQLLVPDLDDVLEFSHTSIHDGAGPAQRHTGDAGCHGQGHCREGERAQFIQSEGIPRV